MHLAVTGRGATLRDAFVDAAAAVLALTIDPADVEEVEVREVRAHGASEAALLTNWINECLYVHEVEGFACSRVELRVFETRAGAGGEPLRLHSLLHGEPLDPVRHRTVRTVKGVEPHSASVRALADQHEVAVIVHADCL